MMMLIALAALVTFTPLIRGLDVFNGLALSVSNEHSLFVRFSKEPYAEYFSNFYYFVPFGFHRHESTKLKDLRHLGK